MAKILIVEDDNLLARMYQDIMVSQNYEVVVVDSGDKALLSVKSFRPDAILLDIMLPGKMNGFDLLEQLQKDEQLKSIPVIVMTNLDSERQTAMQMGASDYILKVDKKPKEVIEIIQKNISKKYPLPGQPEK